MLTIYDWFGYEIPLKERYRLIKAAGFDGVLLWWSNGFGRDSLGWNDYRRGPEMARAAGLFIENIHTPCDQQNDLWLDHANGEAVADCYLQCVADCAEFEIPTMVVHLPNDEHPHSAVGLDRMRRIAEKAERLGVNVALENLRNRSNLSYVLAQVDSPRVGFCYDCAHHYSRNPDADFLTLYGDRLMALHLHDNGDGDTHRLPLDGTVDWATAMRNIAATGYTGPTAIEAMNWAYTQISAAEFLQKAIDRAKKLVALRKSC